MITDEALTKLWNADSVDVPLLPFLSAHTRQAAGRGEPVLVTTDWPQFAARHSETTVVKKVEKVLRFLVDRSSPGATVAIPNAMFARLPPLFDARSDDEVSYLFRHLVNLRLIEQSTVQSEYRYVVTVAGWQQLQDPQEKAEPPLMHQKFGILRAEPQLAVDFDACQQDKAGLGILFFDIDHFKSLNTKYTESVVDRHLLRPLQEVLVKVVNGRGFCYLVGGDEFIILLRNSNLAESVAFAERLSQAVQDLEVRVGEESVRLAVSTGVAHFPSHGARLEDVRANANKAENRAKAEGKGRVFACE